MRFSVGVNYWPRSTATAMWRDFDAGEIAGDFAHIAALGLDGLRFFLRWDDFQPEPDRIDATMLGRLETFVALAHDAGLRVVPTLFAGHIAGANFLPPWALDRKTPSRRFPTYTGDVASNYGAANLYGEALREPQLVFARTIGERLREHPAIRAWDLGNAFSRVREPVHAKLATGEHSSEPAGEREMAAWSAALTRALRDSSRIPATAGVSFDDLATDRDVRLGMLCAPFAFASIAGLANENPFGQTRLDPEATPFFAMLAASFSQQPVFVTAFGIPTCTPDTYSAVDAVFSDYPCATDEESATFAIAVLERLHGDGRLGAYWWNWADYPSAIAARAPFDTARHEAVCGLIRSDGSEKPLATAISAFARENRTVLKTNDMPMIAAAYYYRTLPKSGRTLYEAFLRYVDERRRAMEIRS